VFPSTDYTRRNRETGERELVIMMRWAIVPWFAKSNVEFRKLSTINARSDRLTESRMWTEPLAKRRCLGQPANGLYEWPKESKAISQFCDEIPTAEEAGDSDNLFGTPLKAPKKSKKPEGGQTGLQDHNG